MVPLDSESRWRLVRKLRAREAEVDPSVEDITLRSAKADDMKQIAEIYNYYVTNSVVTFDIEATTEATWTEKLEYLEGLELPFIVAQSSSGTIFGFAYVAPWRQKAAYRRTVEDTIYLRPAAIGKRIGTRLLTELIERSRAAGVKEIVAVISDKGADPSIALHEAFGFKRQGHLAKVGFKFNRWLGTVLLQKSL
ncbi:MAG: N-acetyltransferase family protein [Micrococcales bacterium]|nr:N-acetyltransferase family protein [Micrococcales bacterium]NBS85910.1 N-acetyltransferase family protein [Micrococcales bacterium]